MTLSGAEFETGPVAARLVTPAGDDPTGGPVAGGVEAPTLWAVDAGGLFTFASGALFGVAGVDPAVVTGRSVYQVYAAHPVILEHVRRALTGETFVAPIQVGDSSFEVRYAPQKDAAGGVTGVIASASRQRRIGPAGEDPQTAALLAALESAADGILVVDNKGRIVTSNRKFIELWRFPEGVVSSGAQEQMIAHVLEQVREPDEFLARLREVYGDSTAEARDIVELRDGRVLERYSLPHYLHGDVVGRVSSFRDITERRRTEVMLQRRAERAARFQEALVGLARSRSEELDVALATIVGVDARTLGVSRVSIWLFEGDGSELVCRTFHSLDGHEPAEGLSLRSEDLPDYFAALHQRRVIAADDAISDPATHEFADSYLIPLGITSMMDVPIWRGGEMVGVVCHEHVGERRPWLVEEQDFAGSIADMVSLALEASDRRKAEAALRASEASYRALFELSNDAICVHDLDTGEVIDANRAACALHGYSLSEMRELGAEVLSAGTAPDTHDLLLERFRRAAGGEPQRVEWQARHRSGREFWQEAELQRVAINGRDRLVTTSRDITARKKAEEVLRRSHEELERLVDERTRDLAETNRVLEAQIAERERAEAELQEKSSELHAVFHAMPDLYFRLDPVGRILDFQAGASSNLFVPPEEFMGQRVQDVLLPDTARLVDDALREVARLGELVCIEYTLPLPDGERAFEARLLPFSNSQTIIIVRDITEKQAAELALRQSEEHYRRLTENSSDVATILDARGVSSYYSPAVQRVLGYEPAELLGTSSFERIHPEDHQICRQVLRAIFDRPGVTQKVEFRHRHKDGSWRFVEAHGRTLLPDSPDGGAIINLRDVTERRAVQEALTQAKVEAENANRAKSEFLSRMSHELRTPMNSILGFGQLLERKELSDEHRRGVDHILRAGRHLLNLINEVLDLSRIEADHQQFSLEPVRVDVAIQEALSLIRPLAVQRRCRVQDAPGIPAVHVHADRQRLTQVLLNLLSNAVKYNRPDGEVSVVWESDGAGAQARGRIGVRDTGPGIAPEDIPRVFEPFERLGAERTGEEGTGLGLALSRRLVEAMGGTLTLDTVVGEGSTFWITLQVEASPLERLGGAQEKMRDATPGTLPSAKVLYIEDNLANLSLVETILELGPEIDLIPALQGQLGVELACEHRPDLILLDLHLPDIPGAEVLRRLQSNSSTRDIPVVVISADATPGSVERLLRSGARAYLTKPLDVDEFLGVVQDALKGRDGG